MEQQLIVVVEHEQAECAMRFPPIPIVAVEVAGFLIQYPKLLIGSIHKYQFIAETVGL